MAIQLLKDLRLTIKELVFNACLEVLTISGFTVDDSNFYITKVATSAYAMINRYRDTKYKMPFVKQREKLKCCQRICRFIMLIDIILQAHLHNIVRHQIMQFEADIRRHFKYVPVDDYSSGTDMKIVQLETERSTEDPKVSVKVIVNSILIASRYYQLLYFKRPLFEGPL